MFESYHENVNEYANNKYEDKPGHLHRLIIS